MHQSLAVSLEDFVQVKYILMNRLIVKVLWLVISDGVLDTSLGSRDTKVSVLNYKSRKIVVSKYQKFRDSKCLVSVGLENFEVSLWFIHKFIQAKLPCVKQTLEGGVSWHANMRTCFIRQVENIAHSNTSHVKNALHNLKPWNAAQEQSSPRQLPPQTLKSQCAIFKNYQRKKQNAKSLSKMRSFIR